MAFTTDDIKFGYGSFTIYIASGPGSGVTVTRITGTGVANLNPVRGMQRPQPLRSGRLAITPGRQSIDNSLGLDLIQAVKENITDQLNNETERNTGIS